jgi:ribosomal protein S18 acetylase RimI-like enzyme
MPMLCEQPVPTLAMGRGMMICARLRRSTSTTAGRFLSVCFTVGSSKRAEIKRMRVSPAHQRNGFGQAILSALERRAVELGYAALHLDTTVQQKAAQGLYVKNGYREAGRSRTGRFESVFYERSDLPQNT